VIILVSAQPIYNSGIVLTIKENGFIVKKVIPGSPAGDEGLTNSTVISSVDDIDITELYDVSTSSNRDFLLSASTLFSAKTANTLTDTEGNTYQLSINPLPFIKKLPLINRTFFINAVIGLAIVLMGLFFYLKGDKGRPLILFFLFTACAGVAVTVSFFYSYWSLPLLKLRFIALDVAGFISGICIILFAASFPNRRRTRLPIIAAAAAGILTVKYLLLLLTPFHLFGTLSYLIHGFISVSIITAVALFITSYRTSNAGEQRKLRWIFLGASCSVVPYLFYLIYVMVLRNYIGYSTIARLNQTASFFLLLFPLSVGIGMTRTHLIDVDWLLKHLFIFLFFGLLFPGLLMLFFVILQERSPLLFFLSAIVTVGVLIPFLYPRINRLADKLIYKKRLMIHELYNFLGRELIKPRSTDDIFTLAGTTLSNIYVCEETQFFHIHEDEPAIDFSHHIGKKQHNQNQTVMVKQLLTRYSDLVEPVTVENGGVIVPIHTQKRPESFLHLGKRLDHDVFLKGDLRNLTTLSFQIAQALDNALLYEELNDSLKEKELLLQEIHHRVKNNMQVMSSILYLQSDYANNEEITKLLAEASSRIDSMSLIHETLYQSKVFGEIDMHDYLESVIFNLNDIYTPEADVRFDLHIDGVVFPLKYAIPCGLIVNELVSNAFKHGFLERTEGTITIGIEPINGGDDGSTGRFQLSVENDGNPLPHSFDFTKTDTLGLKLVQILAQQMHGTCRLETNPHPRFIIEFQLRK
jgi:two-component sensor histidine kinase